MINFRTDQVQYTLPHIPKPFFLQCYEVIVHGTVIQFCIFNGLLHCQQQSRTQKKNNKRTINYIQILNHINNFETISDGLHRDVPFTMQPQLPHIKPFIHKTMKPMEILNYCSHSALLQLMYCSKLIWPQFQLFCHSISTCYKQTLLASQYFLPVGVLPYLVIACQNMHC